jgi:hypothetical protein
MWLILTDTGDPEGHWLADGLSPRLPGPIVHLTGRDLVEGCRWEHRFDDQGEWFRLYTATGVVVDNRNVRGVINRLRVLPAGTGLHRRFVSRGDEIRDTGAMLLSCLSTFTCPVLNPPGAHGVSGDQRSPREWAGLAQRAGFRSPDAGTASIGRERTPDLSHAWEAGIRGLPMRQLLVVGQRILSHRDESALPEGVAACCRRLAAFARCPLLSIQLVQTSVDEWTFRAADAHPALLPGGIAVLDAIAAALGPTLVAPTRVLAAKPSTPADEGSYQSTRRSVPVAPGAQLASPALS